MYGILKSRLCCTSSMRMHHHNHASRSFSSSTSTTKINQILSNQSIIHSCAMLHASHNNRHADRYERIGHAMYYTVVCIQHTLLHCCRIYNSRTRTSSLHLALGTCSLLGTTVYSTWHFLRLQLGSECQVLDTCNNLAVIARYKYLTTW